MTVPSSDEVRVVQRFLVGAEAEPAAVRAAVAAVHATAADPGTAVPPDARGALADAVDRFFEQLVAAYGELHAPVASGHRRDVDDLIAVWQTRLDDAADDVDDRAKVVTGELRPTAPAKRPWGTKDRPAAALGFVVVALLTAGILIWSVLHGWPMEPGSFGL